LIEQQKEMQEKLLQAQKEASKGQEEKPKPQNEAINILEIKTESKAADLDDL
jgi:hypothetical protein